MRERLHEREENWQGGEAEPELPLYSLLRYFCVRICYLSNSGVQHQLFFLMGLGEIGWEAISHHEYRVVVIMGEREIMIVSE